MRVGGALVVIVVVLRDRLVRGFVADRYAALLTAFYNGATEADISTEVTFEDGRKGKIAARLKIQDLPTTLAPAGLEKAA